MKRELHFYWAISFLVFNIVLLGLVIMIMALGACTMPDEPQPDAMMLDAGIDAGCCECGCTRTECLHCDEDGGIDAAMWDAL